MVVFLIYIKKGLKGTEKVIKAKKSYFWIFGAGLNDCVLLQGMFRSQKSRSE